MRDAPEGPPSVESGAEEALAASTILEAAPTLQEEGFDALIIGCFGDPGMDGARELVEIPVVGPGQSSLHLAAQLGDAVAVLTVVAEVVPPLRRLSRRYGLEGLVSSVRAVDVPVLELRSRREEVLDALEREADAAVQGGADTLVLGCMTMGFLNVAGALGKRLDVPVVNPAVAALKTAEAMVRVGVTHSRRAYPAPPARVVPGTGTPPGRYDAR